MQRIERSLHQTARVYGDRDDVLVLAHGFGVGRNSWRHLLPALSERYRVVTYDLPGFTPESRGHFDHIHYADLDAYAGSLLATLDTLRVTRCQYVGHSVSGMIGVLASLREPDRFEKLILLAASPRYVDEPGYTGGFTEDGLTALFDSMVGNYGAWAHRFAPIATARPHADPATEEFVRGLLAMRPDAALSIAVSIFRSDLRAALPRVTVPCAILQVSGDAAVPMSVATYLHEHLPGSVMEVIDAEGHVPQLTAPDALLAALRRHLR